MKKYNVGISVLMWILAGGIFYFTKDFPKYYAGAPGSGFWPRVIAAGILIVSAVLLAETFIKKEEREEPPIVYTSQGIKRVYILFGLILLFGIGLQYLGLVISAVMFVPAVMFTLGEKRVIWLVAGGIGVTAAIYVIFAVGLNVVLPKAFFM
ncbi:tripartite tricarboxylate transporter TctB family protein [Extibacter muris]|uniref:tripartite tricarboxylate transporter TctB family protein n=1 Tax=Extibacter muris TaxID=1796622 RepID=UPI001D06983A|nr:tripartite tricarboxylate transporter TctB family protein [Extibacter muris]MCB6200857.1 tripartite tricarboxylate transporter TctB family protein [Extibacter muris]MCQ4662187.1 tripartite tricarboxylate transporter TctB family protein [Extibacter muris]MCQ4691899.1 tripartite tricarboxylate transporter TctB family protein [Extibacter muris]